MKKLLAAGALGLLALGGCTASGGQMAPRGLDPATPAEARMRTDMETLADDRFGGREAGTEGYVMAAAHVADRFAEIGLRPGGDGGTYYQDVSLRRRMVVPGTAEARLGGVPLPADAFLLLPLTYSGRPSAAGEVVFMGYGLDAPRFGQDAYDRLDVADKIVAVLPGVPDGLPADEAAHLSSARTKAMTAADHGAAGIAFLDQADGGSYGLRMLAAEESEAAVLPGRDRAELGGMIFLTEEGRIRLSEAAGLGPDGLAPGTAPRALGVEMAVTGEVAFEDFTAPNVVGVIEGADPALRDEIVVLTAHLDHIGTGEGMGDVINNGAMDNAGGVSTMIEAARKFAESGEAPRRTVVFLALTAEEKGLLGSEYFAGQPSVPGTMVANVNLDMPILTYDFADVIAFGAEHSDLKGTAERVAGEMNMTVTPDPLPEMTLFIRSDHYSFVKEGVPSIFLFTGFADGGRAAFEDFMENHYHQPSDEVDLGINYRAALRFADLNYRLARSIANADAAPRWNEDDYFGDYFGRPRD